MRRHVIAAFIVLLLGIGVMTYAGSQLLKTEQIYREGNAVYELLSENVRGNDMTGFKTPVKTLQTGQSSTQTPQTEGSQIDPQADIPHLGIDFEALETINRDAVAWLYCPDTVIDYPVMRADDYCYYLDHLPDGTKNANGSLFLDYNCAPDFSDRLSVVYGHNMKSNRMFGSLMGYKDQSYYEAHPFMYLYTESGNYRIELLYGCVIGAGQWRDRAFMYEVNIRAFLTYAAYNTTFYNDTVYMEGDRIIALSTCSYEFDDARYVVAGILREEEYSVVR